MGLGERRAATEEVDPYRQMETNGALCTVFPRSDQIPEMVGRILPGCEGRSEATEQSNGREVVG